MVSAMPLKRRQLLQSAGALALGACVRTSSKTTDTRPLTQVVPAAPHKDGAGVKLNKLLGGRALPLLDPFLMLDGFHSSDPRDFIAGFPNHPHRGFETVTIMLDGVMEHKDSVGNHGRISGGGLQWMTAGSGIIHAEMPQTLTPGGALWGFQLWVNLPAKDKWQKPRYQDMPDSSVPTVTIDDASVRVVRAIRPTVVVGGGEKKQRRLVDEGAVGVGERGVIGDFFEPVGQTPRVELVLQLAMTAVIRIVTHEAPVKGWHGRSDDAYRSGPAAGKGHSKWGLE
jgi:hypothetical protein